MGNCVEGLSKVHVDNVSAKALITVFSPVIYAFNELGDTRGTVLKAMLVAAEGVVVL